MSWKDTLKKNFVANERDHMRRRAAKRISTKDSTGQDEEAAKRTENTEAELLAEIRARNKKAKETLRGELNE